MENFSCSGHWPPCHILILSTSLSASILQTSPWLPSLIICTHQAHIYTHSLTHFDRCSKIFPVLHHLCFLKFCQLSSASQLQRVFPHRCGMWPRYSEEFVHDGKSFGTHSSPWHFILQRWKFSHLYFITAYRMFLEETKGNKRGSPEDQEVEKGTSNSLSQWCGHMTSMTFLYIILMWSYFGPQLRDPEIVRVSEIC